MYYIYILYTYIIIYKVACVVYHISYIIYHIHKYDESYSVQHRMCCLCSYPSG